jgi:hypothetical protein
MEKHFLRTTRDVDIEDFDERWWTTFGSPRRELLTAPLQRCLENFPATMKKRFRKGQLTHCCVELLKKHNLKSMTLACNCNRLRILIISFDFRHGDQINVSSDKITKLKLTEKKP